MTALDVALVAGLSVTRKGTRGWACCPLHGEKTASLCFFPDGRWYCFSCHAHGDAADLYAALRGVSLGEALKAVRGNNWAPAPVSPGVLLRRKVATWRDEHRTDAVRRLHLWGRFIDLAETYNKPETLQGLDEYWSALVEKARAEDELNLLDSATPALLLHLMDEEGQAQ